MEKERSLERSSMRAPVAVGAFFLGISMILSGCADDFEKCLGSVGNGKKAQLEKSLRKCRRQVSRHDSVGSDDLTRNPNAANNAFMRADTACDSTIEEAKRYNELAKSALTHAENDEDSSKVKACKVTVDVTSRIATAAGGSTNDLLGNQK